MAKFYDTLIWEYIQNPWIRWLSLDSLAEKHFNYEMIKYEDITLKWRINFRDIKLETASKYSWEDVFMTKKLYDLQKEKLSEKEKEILEKIEIPLMISMKDLELNWVKVDEEKLENTWKILEKNIKILEEKIHHLAWEEFNINSPKQVWDVLFEKMGLPKWKKTKTWYSVNEEVLTGLASNFTIAKHIIDYRKNSKLLSTYVHWLLDIINPYTWKIHSSYNQAVTATWRLSSTNPNMQNIPTKSENWANIRSCFIPFEEWDLIMWFDYSQIEVRLLALMSWDEKLIESFKKGEDIHSSTAKIIFWKDEVTSDERRYAKSVNFWVIYWVSPFWLAKIINTSQKEAQEYIKTFYEKFPRVKEFFEETIKKCEETWYVETLFWRKRYIEWINNRNKMIKSASEREAINTPLQWTAADIIKIATIKVDEFLKKNNLKSKVIIQVHDELVFNVPEDEKEILIKNIPEIMQNVLQEEIELKVDYSFWQNWSEAK